MLGKLLKHEWNATARKYGLFYLVLGIITILAIIVHALPVDHVLFTIGEVSFLVLYILVLCGVFFCSTGMAVVRFYKNMVSDEGYLTFTLPAKVEQLVFSKFLVAVCWQITTMLLVVLSLLSVFVIGHIEWSVFCEGVAFVTDEMGVILPVFGIMMLVSFMYQMLLYYLSIAVGQLFGNHKILASVIAYCALSFGIELIMMVVIIAVCGVIGFVEVSEQMSSLSGMTTFYGISIGWMAVLGAIEYFVICHLLKKKLNLN